MGTIVPILYKPGILKDGSSFQGEYCSDSQWVRFVNKMPQSMGGVVSVQTIDEDFVAIDFGNVRTFASIDNYIYFSTITNRTQGSFKIHQVQKTSGDEISVEFTLGLEGNFSVTQIFTFFTTDEKKFVVFYVTENDFNETSFLKGKRPACIYLLEYGKMINEVDVLKGPYKLKAGKITITDATENQPEEIDITLKDPQPTIFNEQGFAGDGGVIFSPPYLFFYGSDGHVFWTRGEAFNRTFFNDSLVIPEEILEKPIAISGEKIIYGALTRGGATTPTIIFWTTGSVIKFSNSGELTIPTKGFSMRFNVQVITNEISVLSPKCIVNFNGVFYWVGYGIFYTYSGVVDILKNTMNQQFFHENIDYNNASKVFAVKYPTRHEIWWFYPTKDSAGECKNAIIYNVQDDVWYNTKIDAQSSVFDSKSGEFFTYGLPITPTESILDNIKAFWKLETGNSQLDTRASILNRENVKIDSYFITPWVSYATFNNFKQPVGNKKFMQVKQIEPNFAISQTRDDIDNSKMYVQVLGRNFANSEIIESPKITFNKNQEYISISNFQARNIAFKFGREDIDVSFKSGVSFFEADEGDGQV